MKFIKSKESELHPNYLSRVIQVTEEDFSPHPHPDVTKLKRCRIGGDTIYNVLVGIDSKPGKYVFFPASTQINPEFLRYANLYRKPEMNANPEDKPGLFEENGRVKSVRLKGTLDKVDENGNIEKITLSGAISDGFMTELSTVLNFILDNLNIEVNENDIEAGTWFDTIEHDGKSFWLSKKFIPKLYVKNETGGDQSRYKRRQKKLKRFNRVIPEQFKFHYDTTLVKKCPFVVQPNDYIHISSKWHGCVDKDTIINTNLGDLTIGEIVNNKLNVNVKAFDIENNNIVYVPIDNWYTIPNDGDWYELTLEDGRTIQITGNNPVWLPELNCYRRVEDLNINDILLVD